MNTQNDQQAKTPNSTESRSFFKIAWLSPGYLIALAILIAAIFNSDVPISAAAGQVGGFLADHGITTAVFFALFAYMGHQFNFMLSHLESRMDANNKQVSEELKKGREEADKNHQLLQNRMDEESRRNEENFAELRGWLFETLSSNQSGGSIVPPHTANSVAPKPRKPTASGARKRTRSARRNAPGRSDRSLSTASS